MMVKKRTMAVCAGLVGGGMMLAASASALDINVSLGLFGGDSSRDRTADAFSALKFGKAKNVILFIGDGMGDSEITIARNYEKGAAGRLSMDALPLTGEYTTYAVKEGTPATPDYVPDSAATGTAWATGKKTYNNGVSVDPVTYKPVRTILELAQQAGFKTGNVTTSELTDATPAVLDSHITRRGCQGPLDCGQIGETVEFDKSVKVALDWATTHPDTLIVVTADHGHTAQIIEPGSTSPGRVVTVTPKEGQPMMINDATSTGSSQSHTGTEVRIAAQGPQAANVLGITDQTDLFHTLGRALGVE